MTGNQRTGTGLSGMVTQELVNKALEPRAETRPSWAKSTGTSLGWTLISALLIAIAYSCRIRSIISDTLSSAIANRCAQFPSSEAQGSMNTSFGCSDFWERLISYHWLIVFKATHQSRLPNDSRNRCAVSWYPFPYISEVGKRSRESVKIGPE